MMDLAELDANFDPNMKPAQGVHLEFFYMTSKDGKQSREQGRPIYRDYEFVRIRVAGDKDTLIERPATEMDRRKFAVQYKQFLARESQNPEGYPLKEWAGLSRAQVEELKYFNIHTVEQLASVSDANGQKFVGFAQLRDKAKKFLEQLAAQAPIEKMEAELASRDTRIAILEKQLADLTKRLEEVEDA